jgi:hypothetical protein
LQIEDIPSEDSLEPNFVESPPRPKSPVLGKHKFVVKTPTSLKLINNSSSTNNEEGKQQKPLFISNTSVQSSNSKTSIFAPRTSHTSAQVHVAETSNSYKAASNSVQSSSTVPSSFQMKTSGFQIKSSFQSTSSISNCPKTVSESHNFPSSKSSFQSTSSISSCPKTVPESHNFPSSKPLLQSTSSISNYPKTVPESHNFPSSKPSLSSTHTTNFISSTFQNKTESSIIPKQPVKIESRRENINTNLISNVRNSENQPSKTSPVTSSHTSSTGEFSFKNLLNF